VKTFRTGQLAQISASSVRTEYPSTEERQARPPVSGSFDQLDSRVRLKPREFRTKMLTRAVEIADGAVGQAQVVVEIEARAAVLELSLAPGCCGGGIKVCATKCKVAAGGARRGTAA
jgi:hypothetical protein